MTTEEMLNDPRINMFDIVKEFGRPYSVVTYRRPYENDKDYQARHLLNIEYANRLTKKPGY